MDPVHVADNAEAVRIILFWLFVNVAGVMVIYTIAAFRNGKNVR